MIGAVDLEQDFQMGLQGVAAFGGRSPGKTNSRARRSRRKVTMTMEYEILSTLPQKYPHFALLKTPIVDESGKRSVNVARIDQGESCREDFLPNSSIRMDPEWPGMQLAGVMGNVDSLLIIHTKFKEIIERFMKPQEVIEFLPLSIINHKGRVASRDYFLVNPVGTLDCLDYKKSAVDRMKDGRVIGVDKFVLSKKKIAWEPALFRPLEAPTEYIINGKITTAFKESGFPDRNVFVESLEIV
jgi:hypothetical protein